VFRRGCLSALSPRAFAWLDVSERLLAVGSIGTRASPAVREPPPTRGMIAEVLLLVDLVDRVGLVARDPLPADRRQREQTALLRLRPLGQTDRAGQPHQHQRSA